MHRVLAVLTAAVLAATLMVAAAPAGAAPPTAVDFTIEETLTVSEGFLKAGDSIPNCESPVVTTENFRLGGGGDVRTFAGDKVFTCASGDTFTLSFNARVRDCSATDSGSWRVTGGTGTFAGLRGNGRLVGTYVGGDSCGPPTGIDDNYTGRFFLP